MTFRTRILRWRERHGGDEVAVPGLFHELRQPLTGLDAALRLLARELGPAVTAREEWLLATNQLERLTEMVETYAQLVGASSGPTTPFELEPVLHRAVAQLGPRVRAMGSRFALVVEPGVLVASGRPHALLHAVVNVATNAIEALERAPLHGRLEIRAVPGAGPRRGAQVRVSDEGSGIAPDARQALFSLRHTTKPDSDGRHGIGLAFSRRVLRACGGELRLSADDDPLRRPWARTEFVIDLAPPPGVAAAATGAGRRWPRVAAAAALLAVLAGSAWWVVRRTLPAPEQGAAAPVQGADAAVVSAIDGTLERRDASGAWSTVAVGERLRAEDVVRTPPGSRATLAIGDRSRIALSDATQVGVREITSALQRLRLSRGRLSVDQQPDGARVIVVETERGDAAAQAGAARFSVLSTGESLAVASDAGVVRLQTLGGAVEVKEGEQAVAFRGAAPSRPVPIPRAVLLKLANAAAAAPPALCAVVEGSVRPGAEVRVDGERVDPGPDGRFTRRVARRRGMESVAVETREVTGKVFERRVECAPIDPRLQDFAVRWGAP